MGYRPPKGMAPPWLEGKRTGRPKGLKNYAKDWADAVWGYQHRNQNRGQPPTRGALIWWRFAYRYPDELEEFLEAFGRI